MIEERFRIFLQRLAQYLGPAGQVASEDPTLGPHLIPREKSGDDRDAHDQGQDHFQGRAHRYSLVWK
jgi:hypothetical protein